MANAGKNTNGSQFYITFVQCDWLNKKHTVFGEVVDGWDVLDMIQNEGTPSGKPKSEIQIVECGQVTDTGTKNYPQSELV